MMQPYKESHPYENIKIQSAVDIFYHTIPRIHHDYPGYGGADWRLYRWSPPMAAPFSHWIIGCFQAHFIQYTQGACLGAGGMSEVRSQRRLCCSCNVGQKHKQVYRERAKAEVILYLLQSTCSTYMVRKVRKIRKIFCTANALKIRNSGREISRNILYYNGLCTESPESE